MFENASTQTFILYTESDEYNNLVVDTENADRFEEISISGKNGKLVEKDSLVTLVWEQGGRLFMIKTQSDVETAVKMAEGVNFLK